MVELDLPPTNMYRPTHTQSYIQNVYLAKRVVEVDIPNGVTENLSEHPQSPSGSFVYIRQTSSRRTRHRQELLKAVRTRHRQELLKAVRTRRRQELLKAVFMHNVFDIDSDAPPLPDPQHPVTQILT